MPSKSKQQQKFFGVVKAMQSGDIPKKGEAGKVAKNMSKKEVDKYASTKHKGLPKKVKKETMKISDIKKMVDEELQNVLENLNDPVLKKLRTSAPGTKFPPVNTWWEAQPEDLLSAVYHSKGMLPPSDPAKFEKAYNNIAKQLHKMYPIPADVLPTLDLDDRTEREIAMDAPGINEAKSANALRADYDKAVKKEQALSSLLLINLEKFKAAKAKGDEKAVAKHTKIAGDLSKKKKVATEKASKAYKAYQDKITGLHSDAELELKEGANANRWFDNLKYYYEKGLKSPDLRDPAEKKAYNKLAKQFFSKLREGVYDDMLKAVPDNYSYKNLAADVANIIKNEYGSHNIKPFIQELSKMLKEGKLNEGRGVMDLIKDAVEELMFDSNISEKEAAMELVTAISDEYQFDAKLKEGMLNEMDMNDPVLMAFRASKQNMPKSKSAIRKISFDKYLSLLDMQTDLQNDIKELADLMAQTLRDMEQEAEPGGGPAADRYASLMMKQEKEYKILKAKKAKVDVQIDKYQSL